jgi:hypothetical protein
MAMLINGSRLKLGMELTDLLPAPARAPEVGRESPTVGSGAIATIGVVKVKLSQVVDQSSDQEVPMLPANELSTMRQRFITAFGDSPLPRMEVTDSQLTALQFKLTSGQPPYADFGVWGPYGARIERRLKFVSYALTPSGAWRTLEIPGADCLDTWRDCWAVFKTAAVMLDVARPATLDLYAASFEDRCRRYPKAWHLCAQADIRCRSEFLIEEKRRQEAFHQRVPMLSAYVAIAPWDSVFKAAAADGPFWERELKEQALLFTVGQAESGLEPSWVERQLPDHTSAVEGLGRGGKKRKRKDLPKAAAPAPASGAKGKGKGKGKDDHPRKGKDGLYATARDGSQICFAWNAVKDGCAKTCPQNRAHVCRKCLQPHRAVNCGGGGDRPHM